MAERQSQDTVELMPSLVSALRADVEAICLPNGRMVGSPGHRLVREHLSRRLRAVGCEPWVGTSFEQPYTEGGQSFCNLIAVVRGRNPRLAPLLFVTGTESKPGLRQVFERAGAVDGLSVVPALNRYVGDMSDHGIFRANGVPYFFLSCGRWPHYHQPTDTPDRLNYDKIARMVPQVLAFAAALDSAELPQSGREQFAETLDLEISRLRAALDSAWAPVLQLCGLEAVTTRTDMDRLVVSLLGLGL
jgi:hypothetical protein